MAVAFFHIGWPWLAVSFFGRVPGAALLVRGRAVFVEPIAAEAGMPIGLVQQRARSVTKRLSR
jgi:hypothetical protein